MRRLLFTALLLALAGCGGGKEVHKGGMTVAQCQTADWRGIGYDEGSTGRGTGGIAGHRRACAEHGVSPDLDAYLAGHAQGIAVYCRPQNGFNLGRSGHRYNGGCPFAMEGAFMAALADGDGLYERRSTVDNIRQQLDHARRRDKEIEFQLLDRGAAVASPLTMPVNRIAIGLEIKNMMEEKAALKASIPQLEHDYQAAMADYDAYRASLTGRYASS